VTNLQQIEGSGVDVLSIAVYIDPGELSLAIPP